MTLDEQIEGLERIRQIIVGKGQEITGIFVGLYRMLGDTGFNLEFENDKVRTRIISKRNCLSVYTAVHNEDYGDFYRVTITPEVESVKKGFLRREKRKTGDLEIKIGSGDYSSQFTVPERGDETTPKVFFVACAEHYGRTTTRERIDSILKHMYALPTYLAEYLEQIKKSSAELEKIGSEGSGLEKLRSVLGQGEANEQ